MFVEAEALRGGGRSPENPRSAPVRLEQLFSASTEVRRRPTRYGPPVRIFGLPCGGANDTPTVLGGRSHNRGMVVLGGRERRDRPGERRMSSTLAAVIVAALLGVALMAAQARAATITEYPIPTANHNPEEIAAGADGALWFTETLGHQIGRINSSGAVTEYPLPTANTSSFEIAAGSDGALWFTEAPNQIGRITTSGAVTDYPLPTGQYTSPVGIAAGSDGALWFTEESVASAYPSQIGRITTSGAFSQYPVLGSPDNIAAGPDGALWFTEQNRSQIGRITTSGAVTYYPTRTANSGPDGIAAGPDGALWFTEYGANQIGRISTSGAVTEYPIPTANSGPIRIVAGADGALWFTEQQTNQIGRITTSGAVTEYPIPTANSYPAGIAKGPDGALWFIEQSANKVGRITTGASSLSVGDVAVSEPASGSSAAALQVSLSAASDKPVTVDYATHDGAQPDGATSAENDYTPTQGSLTFAPGETVKTVSVAVNHVGVAEAKEAFTLELSGESGASVGKRVGVVTITNFAREITVSGDQGPDIVRVGAKVSFQGTGWDPAGGVIQVAYQGQSIRSIPASGTFSGSFTLPTFTKDNCHSGLSFTQDGNLRSAELMGRKSQAVAFVHGNVTADGTRILKFNGAICEGETARVPADGTLVSLSLLTVLASQSDDSSYQYLRVLSPAHGIYDRGTLLTPLLRLAFLPGSPTVRLPGVDLQLSKYNTTGKPGVADLPNTHFDKILQIRGYSRSLRSVEAAAGMTCHDGVLYIDGRLDITQGGLRQYPGSACVFAATKGITITGPIEGSPGIISPVVELRGVRHSAVKLRASEASVSNDKVAVKVSCTGTGPCNGAAKITAVGGQAARVTRGRSRVTIIASGRYSVAAGKTRTVRIKLTSAGRRLLRKHHGTLRTALKLTPTGGGKPVSRSLTLKQHKALRHR